MALTDLGSEGGQAGRHHHGGDVLGLHGFAAGVDAQPLQHGLDGLLGERRVLQRIAGAVEADHQAVADQHVLPDALDIGQILDPRKSKNRRGSSRKGGSDGEDEKAYREWCAAHGGFCLLFRSLPCQFRAGRSIKII